MTATLHVRQAGPLVSVQDGGRRGYQRFGVTTAGPMDRAAFALANAIVGATAGQATIEVSLGGLELKCTSGRISAGVAGGEFRVTLNERQLQTPCTFVLEPTSVLRIRPGASGSWCYLAVAGLFATDTWLGSQSATLQTSLCGRNLLADDALNVTRARVNQEHASALLGTRPPPPQTELLAVPGPQDRFFSKASVNALFTEAFTITPDYNRMGVRLQGPTLEIAGELDMPSEPIARGSLQVPGHGDPILLLADHQTTGGYPKIATVISVDQDRFAQLRVGDTVRFKPCDVESAIRTTRQVRARQQQQIEQAIASQISMASRLASQNLVSGVVDAEGDHDC